MPTSEGDKSWRSRLVREVGGSVIIKIGLLTLLWAFFFSGGHRCRLDGPAIASRLALGDHATHDARAVALGVNRCD
jgi:hypothetical protein